MLTPTLQLLKKAESIWAEQGKTEADLSREIGMNQAAIGVAKHRGRLPPVMAGRLAQMLGEDATKWIATAALEAAKNSKARTMLEKHLQATVKGWILTVQILSKNRPRPAHPGVVWALVFVNNPVNHYSSDVVATRQFSFAELS